MIYIQSQTTAHDVVGRELDAPGIERTWRVLCFEVAENAHDKYGRYETFVGPMQNIRLAAVLTRSPKLTLQIECKIQREIVIVQNTTRTVGILRSCDRVSWQITL
jgi:hypothetical protein